MDSSVSRIRLLGSWILGGSFLLAGASKVADPAGFALMIEAYRIIPELAVPALALYLPWMEIAIALSLLTPTLRSAALRIAPALLGLFVIILAVSLIRGLDIDCACFGQKWSSSLGWAFVRSGALLTLSSLLLLHNKPPE